MTPRLPLNTESWAGVKGLVAARLPVRVSLTPRCCVCGWVCVRSYEGTHFVQWVFKELSTETGFPQTTITSTPDTPNFLSSYFFFLPFALISVSPFCNSPEGESPLHIQPTRLGLFSVPYPCGYPLKVRTEAMWGQHISPAPEEKSCVKE